MKFLKRHLKGLFVFVVLAFLIIYLTKVDFYNVWQQLNLVGWHFALIILATLTAYILATKAWQLCFIHTEIRKIGLGRLFVIRQIGEALTLINPTNIVGGELSKIYFLESDGISRSDAGLSIVTSRGLIIISYFILALFVSLYFVFTNVGNVDTLWLILISLLFLSICVLFLRSMFSRSLLLFSSFKILSAFLPSWKWKLKCLAHVKKVNKLLSDLFRKNRKKVILALSLSLLHWVIGTMEFYIILNAFELEISFFDAMLMEVGVMVFKSAGGFIPGQIGIEEYGNKVMLGMLNIEGLEIWVSVSILRRTRQLFWIAISLLFIAIFYNKSMLKFRV